MKRGLFDQWLWAKGWDSFRFRAYRKLDNIRFDVYLWVLGFAPRRLLYWCTIAGQIRFGDLANKVAERECLVYTGQDYVETYLQTGTLVSLDGFKVIP